MDSISQFVSEECEVGKDHSYAASKFYQAYRDWCSGARVSDLLCMSNLAHASKLKEHDDNDDIQGSIRRSAERR